jgi:hypothetical protein
MADPVQGGIGKASQQMMQELQRQMQDVQKNKASDPSRFQGLVAQQVQDPQKVQNVQKVQNMQQTHKVQDTQKVNESLRATDVLKSAAANKTNAPDVAQKVTSTKSSTGMRKLLSQVVEGQNKLDDIIKMATSGKTYGQQDLLAIQASVYKFSQELELTSKVVEKATSGIKQTMQTQV